jgi:heme-degrading monooxygenase HmoA
MYIGPKLETPSRKYPLLKGNLMTTISKDNKVVTLINVFTVEPENQQRLADMLVEATEKTMKNLSGFVSATIHKSADGVRVANYAQWRSRQDFEAMLKNSEATAHMKPIMEIAKFDAHLYEVVESMSVS